MVYVRNTGTDVWKKIVNVQNNESNSWRVFAWTLSQKNVLVFLNSERR